MNKSQFEIELEQLINKHSIENASNTPDYILAQFLWQCLVAYGNAVNARDVHRGDSSVNTSSQL